VYRQIEGEKVVVAPAVVGLALGMRRGIGPTHRLALAVMALLGAVPLLAQNASLTGRITDRSKALIADARVAAISTGTNARYQATTVASGEYVLAPPQHPSHRN
jgi:hypothetical protein